MVSFEEALDIVLTGTPILAPCQAPLRDVLGRYLAEPVVAPNQIPRFASSAVDGYAVRMADISDASLNSPVRLRIAGTIRAGDPGITELASGSAVKVLTGAPLPAQTEAVVMKEHTEAHNGEVLIRYKPLVQENIRPQGEEFHEGDVILSEGQLITPPVIGLLASVGMQSATVRERPRVALIVTGDELVQPGRRLHGSQIYDSNSASLASALSMLPVDLLSVIHLNDDRSAFEHEVGRALAAADLLITAGGASVGDYDYAKSAFEANGVQVQFAAVAMKPGKPTIFGWRERGGMKQLVFGLPGNPVSALVCFQQFVRPAIKKMLGANEFLAPRRPAILGATLKKISGRLEFVRGRVVSRQGQRVVHAARSQGSHMQGGLAEANVLIHFPADVTELPAGEIVTVEELQW